LFVRTQRRKLFLNKKNHRYTPNQRNTFYNQKLP